MAAVFKATEDGPDRWEKPENLRAVANAFWAATHDRDATEREVLANLSLLSGIAISILLDFAKTLEENGK